MCNSGITAYIIQQYEHDMADVAIHLRLLSTYKAHDVHAVTISTFYYQAQLNHSLITLYNYIHIDFMSSVTAFMRRSSRAYCANSLTMLNLLNSTFISFSCCLFDASSHVELNISVTCQKTLIL